MGEDTLHELIIKSAVNASLGWLIVGTLLIALVEHLLDGDLVWISVTVVVLAVVLLPPLINRSPYVMLPWELLLVVSLPIGIRGVAPMLFTSTAALYLATAGLALLVIAELHAFTAVEVTHWFAVLSVIMMTLAIAGLWAVGRYYLDRTLGTTYLTDNAALMTEFAWATVVGVGAGVLFDLYFRPRVRRLRDVLRAVVPA